MFRALIVIAAVVASTSSLAGRLYKCIGPDGVAAYQQAECPKAATEADVRGYQREADAPDLGWAAAQAERDRQLAEQEAAELAMQPQQTGQQDDGAMRRALNPVLVESEQLRRQPPRVADNNRPRRQLADQPRTITDQNGRPYTTQPGTPFVIDQRTGRQCLTNGPNIVECY